MKQNNTFDDGAGGAYGGDSAAVGDKDKWELLLVVLPACRAQSETNCRVMSSEGR